MEVRRMKYQPKQCWDHALHEALQSLALAAALLLPQPTACAQVLLLALGTLCRLPSDHAGCSQSMGGDLTLSLLLALQHSSHLQLGLLAKAYRSLGLFEALGVWSEPLSL